MWLEKLKPEQRKAYDFVMVTPGCALFAQQRTGKTYITMAVLETIDLQLVLIVAPLTSIDLVWTPKLTKTGYLVCRTLEEAKEASKTRGKAMGIALVVHYQYFVKIASRASRLDWDMVVIDESQGIKGRNSGQSRAARKFRHVPRRLALSGTPIDESPIDVWGQMRFVNHEVFGDRWSKPKKPPKGGYEKNYFSHDFCYKSGYMGKVWTFNEAKKKEFLKRLKPHCYRLTTGFLKLKPLHLHLVPVELLGSQRKLYDRMADHGLIKLGRKDEIVGALEVVRQAKCSQIAGGQVLDDDHLARRMGYAKERKLRHLLGTLKPPLAIFCNYRHEIEAISTGLRAAGSSVGELHGGEKEGRNELVRDFQKGKIDYLVGQTRTGGVSIELTRASTLVIYSMNHSYIDFEQLLFRFQGMTQKKEVNVYLIYAVDTVDEEKVEVIKTKESTVYQVVSHLERR